MVTMPEEPTDILLDMADYKTLPDAILRIIAEEGDEKAIAELERRLRIRIHGPGVEDLGPIAERPDDTLIAQIADGDKEAEAEYLRRHGGVRR